MVNNNNEDIRQATAPDTSGEWETREGGLVVSAQGNVRFMARVEPHGPNGELNDGDKTVLAQIVRDHNIVPKLVAALNNLIEYAAGLRLILESQNIYPSDGGQLDAARAALAAVGREEKRDA